jgi:DNA-binding NarL/FixJ family response regulator
MSNNKPSVFLVAANLLLRETLVRLLNKKGALNVCGVSPHVPEISSIVESGSSVLILDSVADRVPDFHFVSKFHAQAPDINVILIDMDCDPEIFLEGVRAGALGYMLKDASAADVLSAVLAVAQGQAICPPGLCAHLFRIFSRQCNAVPSARIKLEFGLTRRQQQIIPLIAQGLTNKEIASQLYLSEQTVKNHIHGIMRRVGAHDRLEVLDQTHFRGVFQ